MPIVKADFLESAITRVFRACGAPEEEARIVAAHLVDAEACGVSSHGILRVPTYVQAILGGKVVPSATLRVVSETAATLRLDGQGGFGQVMVGRALDLALERAERAGICAATLVNCSHTGRLGHYTEYVARRGMAGLMMVNSGGNGQWVAPFGGAAGRLSTNPISMAVPTASGVPLLLDIATSVAPEGRVQAVRATGGPLPAGWIVDHRGQPSTNPADLYGPPRGALLPFGGHKGFGLAMLIDALAGGLSGAGCCHDVDAPMAGNTDGVFLEIINLAAFGDPDGFRRQMDDMIRHVKACPPAAGVAEVLVPGEREHRTREQRLRDGIPVEEATWRQLDRTGRDLGLPALEPA